MRDKLLGRSGPRVSEPALGTMTVLGARKVGRLQDNLGCLDLVLRPEQRDRLDKAGRIELGFPYDFMRDGARSSWAG